MISLDSSIVTTVIQAAPATTADAINSWFTPFHYVAYLTFMVVGMAIYYQYKWTKVCRTKVLVLVKKADGHGDYQLAPQEGGSVSLTNPDNATIRTWPMTELATISVPYPGTGLVPAFLQKTIQMIQVEEGDWEPITNRSPHRKLVASPDVKEYLTKLGEWMPAEIDGKPNRAKEKVTELADKLGTAPTRELIASPALLGNLIHEKISEAVLTVNKEMMDALASLTRKLTNLVSPMMLYICSGVLLAGIIAVIVLVVKGQTPVDTTQMDTILKDLEAIKQGIGVR